MNENTCHCKEYKCKKQEELVIICENCGKEEDISRSVDEETPTPQAKGLATATWMIGIFALPLSKFSGNLFIFPTLNDSVLIKKRRICDDCLNRLVKKGKLRNIGDPFEGKN